MRIADADGLDPPSGETPTAKLESIRTRRRWTWAAVVLFAWLAIPASVQAQHGVRGGADSVKVRVVSVDATEVTGDAATVAITIRVAFDHASGFHTWPHEPLIPDEFRGVMPIATNIEVSSLPEGARLDKIVWPQPVPVTVRYTSAPVELLSYTGTSIATVHVLLDRRVEESDHALFDVTYQACDEEICYPPRTVKLAVTLHE